MSERIGSLGYDIILGRGEAKNLGEKIKPFGAARALVVTDSNVQYLLSDIIRGLGKTACSMAIPAGEENKNCEIFLKIVECMATLGLNRSDLVLAIGGGVVGDVAGFAAATYMRGVRVIQVPTTLLAMIDSSIGGKTAVNLGEGKNLLGAFHDPSLVVIDPDFLTTLPAVEWKNGLGEAVKYACLAGGRTLELLEDGLTEDNLCELIGLCAAYKAEIVAEDARENGKRRLLNLGHTLAHAIEKKSDYAIPHGIAVANGLAIMARAAERAGEISRGERDRLLRLLEKYDLLCDMPSTDELVEICKHDKKAVGTSDIYAVTFAGFGDCRIRRTSFDAFADYVRE